MNTTGKKYGGRSKGTPNKNTNDLRIWITSFIKGNRKQIEDDWSALEPKERIVIFEKLLKYALPQLQSVSNTIDFDKFSDDDLDKIINQLKSNYE